MDIEHRVTYYPPALEGLINGPTAGKRLRNRDGEAVATEDGQVVWAAEGRLLDVNAQALTHAQENPGHSTRVIEFSCGSLSFK